MESEEPSIEEPAIEVPCAECHKTSLSGIEPMAPLVLLAALGRNVRCATCNARMSAFTALWRLVEFDHFGHITLALGAVRSSTFTLSLRANESTLITREAIGIEEDVELLSMFLTPQGDGPAAMMMSNQIPIARLRLPLPVFGMPRGPQSEVPLAGFVQWVPKGVRDSEVAPLVDAGVAFMDATDHEMSFEPVVMPAQIAVELAVTRVADELLAETSQAERRQRFLDDAGYGHILAVVLPALVVARFGPDAAMPEQIQAQLQAIRRARNDIAHRGRMERDLPRHEAAMMLVASAVGVAFCQLTRARLALATDS